MVATSIMAPGGRVKQLLHRIRQGLARGAYPNERAVSTSIVVPVLRALGWDDSDPEQVLARTCDRAQTSLRCATLSAPCAGRLHRGQGRRTVERCRPPVVRICFHEGVPLAILTDGREWSFYLPAEQGRYDDRRVYRLAFDERDPAQIAERLDRYLRRDRLASGEAIDAARQDYRAARSRREALDTLPRAWADLLAEPDGLLIDLLLERTEALCGYRPQLEQAERFLRERPGAGEVEGESQAPSRASGRRSGPPPADVAAAVPAGRVRVSWRVGGRTGTARTGIKAFAGFLPAVFDQFPARHDHIVAACRTRKRANIATVAEDVYPGRPEPGLRSSRRLPNVLYLGTNLSSGEKLKIAGQVCAAVGLTLGVDAGLEL